MTAVKWTTTTSVEVGAEQLATIFCEMDDDAQAQFFVHVARIMAGWPPPAAGDQVWYVAGHLCECECSTPQARQWIADLAEHIAVKIGRQREGTG